MSTETFKTGDPWLAAYLCTQGVELLRVEARIDVAWKSNWVFSNRDDLAWTLVWGFRNDDEDILVPLKTYRSEYRRLLGMGDIHRGIAAGERANGHDATRNK